MSRSGSQQRVLIGLLGRLRRHWRTESALPTRIDALLGKDRRLGSRDRRLYREMIYTALRYLPWIEPLLDSDPSAAIQRVAWLAPDTPLLRPLRAELTADFPPLPAELESKARVLGEDPAALTPRWFARECPEAAEPPLRDCLLSRAPLWLRLQTPDPEPVRLELDQRGWGWRMSPLLAGAIELAPDSDVAKTEAYLSGKIEIQDIGSQLVLASVGVPPGGRWLDACAGAGGKTLQLAGLLGTEGRVDARDLRRAPLEALFVRAARAGLSAQIEIGWDADPSSGYDGVLVDAPCSGSGTWRRFPHLRWVTTPRGVAEAGRRQLSLLREHAPRVRPGGLLVYSTCSLCRTENEAVVEAFLAETPWVEPVLAGRRLLPQAHNGDGYFVASFRRAV